MTNHFTKTPFQSWTRNATALLGTVELDVDFAVPLDDMRGELDRLLRSNDLWDGRVGVLQVTDAVDGDSPHSQSRRSIFRNLVTVTLVDLSRSCRRTGTTAFTLSGFTRRPRG